MTDDVFVGRLMSSPVRSVSSDTSARAAAEKMIDADIGSLVVLDEEGRLDGILTATDFIKLAAAGEDADATPVSEYMTTEVETTTANEPVVEVARTIVEKGFHHVPVVDDDNRAVGMITTADLTAYITHIESPELA